MIIDTDEKTVVFPGYAKLTLDDLWSLLELLEPSALDVEETPESDGRVPIKDIARIYRARSRTGFGVYSVVRFEDESWACSCPDWIHRKSKAADNWCKHIYSLHYYLEV